MHNNYYFLKHLSKQLSHHICDYELLTCFTQNKNELIIGFARQSSEFYIKAYLDPSFCCLSFPENFSRARKNSVNLFTDLIGKKVSRVYQFENERCFSIIFESGHQLLFKMHGNRSNIILINSDIITDVFKNNLKNDFSIDIKALDRSLDQSHEAFVRHEGNFEALFPTFGKVLKKYLYTNEYKQKNIDEQWQLLQDTLEKLSHPQYFITELDNQLSLSLLEIGAVQREFHNPIEALDSFFTQYITESTLRALRKTALGEVNKLLKQNENYVQKAEVKLNEIEKSLNYRALADILMANLHNIPPKTEEVTLDNFYNDNASVSIKLKRDLSPQKNAENYYRKAKNQSIETDNLRNNISQKIESLIVLEEQKERIENAQDLRTLRNLVKKSEAKTSKKELHRPFHAFQHSGFDIWVGKNSRSNDLMLQQHSFKDDLWLHAKDVSGSHVLLKYKAGKNFPKDIIEKAAELAAYHSKRKSDTLCPVIVTPRKYVRKRKGDPPGAVVVDKEEKTILVRPNNWT